MSTKIVSITKLTIRPKICPKISTAFVNTLLQLNYRRKILLQPRSQFLQPHCQAHLQSRCTESKNKFFPDKNKLKLTLWIFFNRTIPVWNPFQPIFILTSQVSYAGNFSTISAKRWCICERLGLQGEKKNYSRAIEPSKYLWEIIDNREWRVIDAGSFQNLHDVILSHQSPLKY